MKWTIKDPARGDMIRVELGGIYHFGIYVSDDEVIQFGLAPSRRNLLHDSEVEVLSSDIDAFLAGGFLEVCEFDRKERKKNRSSDEVVAFARSKLGMRGYNIIYNNCEHFATECVTGTAVCRQTESVREMFRNMPIVDIYLAELPERDGEEPLSCALRRQEIDEISNPRVRREKYYVWKLLEYGLQRSLGIRIGELNFVRDEGGRYSCDRVEFSLAHSKGALAVAVSRKTVGVDIEPLDTECTQAMAERVMTQGEYATYVSLSEEDQRRAFLECWTAKEALFKASHQLRFDPAAQDTGAGGFSSFEKTIGGKPYVLAVATVTPEKIRFFENITL